MRVRPATDVLTYCSTPATSRGSDVSSASSPTRRYSCICGSVSVSRQKSGQHEATRLAVCGVLWSPLLPHAARVEHPVWPSPEAGPLDHQRPIRTVTEGGSDGWQNPNVYSVGPMQFTLFPHSALSTKWPTPAKRHSSSARRRMAPA